MGFCRHFLSGFPTYPFYHVEESFCGSRFGPLLFEMCVKLSHNQILDSISKQQMEPNELRVIQKN